MFKYFYQYYLIRKSNLFDTGYYLSNNEDVRKNDLNPIMHYVKNGWREKRDPSPNFDTSFYLEQYPDVAKSKFNPLVHYIKFGQKEGRLTKAQGDKKIILQDRSTHAQLIFTEEIYKKIKNLPLTEKVDIIVCVGPNPENFQKCFASIKANTNSNDYVLNVVVHKQDYTKIERFLSEKNVKIFQHDMEFFNYSRANNLVIKDSHNDLVILNDDTEVTENWLEKLRKDSKGVALTGAHTCEGCSGNSDMWGEGQRRITFKPINTFCAYLPRKLVEVVGLFDEEFSYYGGEDNDYSMRTLMHGFPLIISESYVIHKHHKSYGETRHSIINYSRNILKEKHGNISPFELNEIVPLISVIVEFDEKTDQSLHQILFSLSNKYNNLELIVVNKNSLEKLIDFVEGINEFYANIKIIKSQKEKKFENVREIGLRAASGQFVFFVNDKKFINYKIEEYLFHICLNPSLSALYLNEEINEHIDLKNFSPLFYHENYNELIKLKDSNGCLFGRKHVFDNVPFHSYTGEAIELDWILRANRKGYVIQHFFYQKHKDPQSNQVRTGEKNISNDFEQIIEREKSLLNLKREKKISF